MASLDLMAELRATHAMLVQCIVGMHSRSHGSYSDNIWKESVPLQICSGFCLCFDLSSQELDLRIRRLLLQLEVVATLFQQCLPFFCDFAASQNQSAQQLAGY